MNLKRTKRPAKERAFFILLAMLALASALFLGGCSSDQVDEATSDASSQEAQTSDGAKDSSPQDAIAAPSTTGQLRVEGARLVGRDGQAVQLRGVSTHGLAWFPQYVNSGLFRELRQDWGANVVRLALYTAEPGGYCTDGDRQQLAQLVETGVQLATEADLYVIVDWHVLSDADPSRYEDEAVAFFASMSEKFADYDNVIYEICNEPNGGTSWDTVKSYAERVIPVIRANAPSAPIIVGTPTWSQDVDKAAANPLDAENVLYALHFYAATHQQGLRDRLTQAVRGGLPVFVSEFGICDASGNGRIDYASADAWVSLMDSLGVSYVCWNLSNKDESSALFRPDCTKASGFTEADLSEEGIWLWSVLHGETPSENAASGSDADEEGTPTKAHGEGVNELSYSMEQTNSWEADGKTYEQYDVTVTNGGAAVDGWEIAASFEAPFSLVDSWNGIFTVDGTTLRIANADYNGSLATGTSAADVGFIICLP